MCQFVTFAMQSWLVAASYLCMIFVVLLDCAQLCWVWPSYLRMCNERCAYIPSSKQQAAMPLGPSLPLISPVGAASLAFSHL